MASLSAELVYDGKAELAEGPVWHDGALWWVDILAGTLNRLDVSSRTNTNRATGDFLGCAVPASDGSWLLARRHDIIRLDWHTGHMETLASIEGPQDRLRFNDGKCDPRGRLIVGTMHRDGKTGAGALYRFSGGSLQRMLDGVTVSNGMDWSPDGKRFYYADSPTGRVDVFDCDPETGAIANRRPLITLAPEHGVPDGLCCDLEGNLWLALWQGGAVEYFDGSTGNSLQRIELPAIKVTSCCFGGGNLEELYITTAWEGNDRAQRDAELLAGGIFVVQPGIRGKAPARASLDRPAV